MIFTSKTAKKEPWKQNQHKDKGISVLKHINGANVNSELCRVLESLK